MPVWPDPTQTADVCLDLDARLPPATRPAFTLRVLSEQQASAIESRLRAEDAADVLADLVVRRWNLSDGPLGDILTAGEIRELIGRATHLSDADRIALYIGVHVRCGNICSGCENGCNDYTPESGCLIIDCATCHGTGGEETEPCVDCGGSGHRELPGCPLGRVSDDAWQAMNLSRDLQTTHMPPVLGGTLNQSRTFLEAHRLIVAEESRIIASRRRRQ